MSASQAATTLHFNWYGYVPSAQITADFIHIVNPGQATSSGWISLPGQSTQTFSVSAGGYYYYEFPAGASGGPVTIQITSGGGVLASQRVQFYNSFHEVNALEIWMTAVGGGWGGKDSKLQPSDPESAVIAPPPVLNFRCGVGVRD